MFTNRTARGVGWFSIAMGLAEMLATRSVAKTVGLNRRPGLVRMFGMGDMATGVGLLSQRNRRPWLWARVAGDVMGLITLGSAFGKHRRGRGRIGAALAAVAGVTALDLMTGRRLGRKNRPFNYVI
jgi:hypothetical protein